MHHAYFFTFINFSTMNKVLKLVLVCFVFLSSSVLMAQHYEVGKTYVFSSEGMSYAVTYDKDGTAKIKRGQTQSQESKAYIFADLSAFDGFSADGNVVDGNITKPLSGYWLIPFSEGAQATQPGGPTPSVTFTCLCKSNKKGTGTCSASYMLVRNTATVTCIPEAGCMECKLKDSKIGNVEVNGSVLLLEAKKVIFE